MKKKEMRGSYEETIRILKERIGELMAERDFYSEMWTKTEEYRTWVKEHPGITAIHCLGFLDKLKESMEPDATWDWESICSKQQDPNVKLAEECFTVKEEK